MSVQDKYTFLKKCHTFLKALNKTPISYLTEQELSTRGIQHIRFKSKIKILQREIIYKHEEAGKTTEIHVCNDHKNKAPKIVLSLIILFMFAIELIFNAMISITAYAL